MKHEQLKFKFDDEEIFYQYWARDKRKIKYLVCALHGRGSHSGYFENLAKTLTMKNIVFIGVDLMGHGRSTGKRGFVKDYQNYIEILKIIIKKSKKLFPGVQIIPLGHSMGGNIVLSYLMEAKDDKLKGIVLSPWIKLTDRINYFQLAQASVIKIFYPSFTREYKFDKSDTKNKKKTDDDYDHSMVSAEMILGGHARGSNIYYFSDRINSSVLMIHGLEDRVTDPGITKEISNENKNLKFVGLRNTGHDILDEAQTEVVKNILRWLRLD